MGALTLYAVEENLAALLDTADMVEDPAQQEAIEREIIAAHMAAVDKRDRVGQFLAHCEIQASGIDAEIKRLQALKKSFETAHDRVEDYIVRVIKDLGTDEKGKYRKLEGHTCSFSIRACPPSVDVKDLDSIPKQHKYVTLKVPFELFERLFYSCAPEERTCLFVGSGIEQSVDKNAIKDELKRGNPVPGAALVADKYTLRRS